MLQFTNLLNYMFGSGSLIRVHYPKCAYGPYREFNPNKNGANILAEVSFLNFNYLVSVTAGGPVSPRGHM